MSQTNKRTVSRPVQGNNSTRKTRPPRPSYAADRAPSVVSQGTVSRPRDATWGKPHRDVVNAVPKIYNPNP
jgi:hypothetical protein